MLTSIVKTTNNSKLMH